MIRSYQESITTNLEQIISVFEKTRRQSALSIKCSILVERQRRDEIKIDCANVKGP